MTIVSGEAFDLLPPQHKTAVLSRPAVQGSLLKFLLSLPHALSIRVTDLRWELIHCFTSFDVQFAISIYLDIGKPQAKWFIKW
jgi:hypothetical protein